MSCERPVKQIKKTIKNPMHRDFKQVLRIGFVSYVNALPFTLPLRLQKIALPFPCCFSFSTPVRLNQALSQGALDLALTSSVAYLDRSGDHLPGFGISAHERVMSVNLYVRKDLRKIKQIAVTQESAASVALLRVLCRFFWNLSASLVPLLEEKDPDAFLLIGDQALNKQTVPGYLTIDLASAWKQETGLPFVFALFILPSASRLKAYQIDGLSTALNRSLNWSAAHPERLDEAARAPIVPYLNLLQYRLGTPEQESLLLFARYYHAL